MSLLHFSQCSLDLTQPKIMGVLNMTPESRYGGGQTRFSADVLHRVETMVNEGAAIIDVGGESTRPGATSITVQEELDRVIPVIEAIQQNFATIISVDTRQPAVMRAALNAGASMINDVNALQAEGALTAVAASNAAVCLMHMQGTPQTMQNNPQYGDVVAEVKAFLQSRVHACLAAGIAKERIVIDPGFGFGKNLAHNSSLLKNLTALHVLGFPLLVGLSRKLMIEAVLGLPVEARLHASLALAVLAVSKGAVIIRAHDVKPTLEAVRMAAAVLT
jgi:dihydropteroate synthase